MTVPLDGLDAFVRRMGADAVQPVSRLVVSRNNLPTDMRIAPMTPQSRPL